MNKLEKIVEAGLLKNNEEIYLSYRDYMFSARIIEDGKFIETHIGKFKAMSQSAGVIIATVDKGANVRYSATKTRPEEVICNGWQHWKNWNGIPLSEIREKLND